MKQRLDEKGYYWEAECLAYDPFAGDFGDQSDRILSDKIVTARKQRKCHICFGNIKPKTRVRVQKAVIDGEMSSCSFCHGCCNAMVLSWIVPDDEDKDQGWEIERRTGVGMKRSGALPRGDGPVWRDKN